MSPNAHGTPANLLPAEPGNARAAKHGVYSADRRLLEGRAREIAESILAAPHTIDLDEIGAAEVGKLTALVEAIDRDMISGTRSRACSSPRA